LARTYAKRTPLIKQLAVMIEFLNAGRIHIDHVPEGVVLAAGMTATVQIDDRSQ